MANNDLDEQRRRWEVERNWDALKLFFECFKYFTALSRTPRFAGLLEARSAGLEPATF